MNAHTGSDAIVECTVAFIAPSRMQYTVLLLSHNIVCKGRIIPLRIQLRAFDSDTFRPWYSTCIMWDFDGNFFLVGYYNEKLVLATFCVGIWWDIIMKSWSPKSRFAFLSQKQKSPKKISQEYLLPAVS